MGNFDELGLDLGVVSMEGMQAAIALHDQTHSLPYHVKRRIMKEKQEKEALGRHKLSEAKTSKGNKSMQVNITPSSFLNKQKVAAKRAAFLALGKLAIDTAASKLPKEVGVLGPMAVAQLLATIPAKNQKLIELQEAALAYAMTVTLSSLNAANILETLTEVAADAS